MRVNIYIFIGVSINLRWPPNVSLLARGVYWKPVKWVGQINPRRRQKLRMFGQGVRQCAQQNSWKN